jgi:acetate kinase
MSHSMNSLDMVIICWCENLSRPEIFTDQHSAHFKMLKPLIALHSAYTVLRICLVKQLKCLCKIFTNFATKFHTHTHSLFFKLFLCHFVTNPTNSVYTCSDQRM